MLKSHQNIKAIWYDVIYFKNIFWHTLNYDHSGLRIQIQGFHVIFLLSSYLGELAGISCGWQVDEGHENTAIVQEATS